MTTPKIEFTAEQLQDFVKALRIRIIIESGGSISFDFTDSSLITALEKLINEVCPHE